MEKRGMRMLHEGEDLISWSHQIYHSELQNCRSANQNYKNATLGPLMVAHSLR